LGVTLQSPVDDKFNYSEEYLRGRITGALGGRAAEQVVYGDVTTGAESDIQQVTRIAREMVTRWGMSAKVGPLSYSENGDGARFPAERPYSDATAKVIDEEVQRIADECLVRATEQLTEHRSALDALASALLEHDSLDEKQIIEVTRLPPPKA
jgi:cell division protease FtsH